MTTEHCYIFNQINVFLFNSKLKN